MNVEADSFFFQGVDQLGGKAGKVYPQALHAIVQFRIDSLNHGVATTVVDVDRGDSTGFHVVQEAAVAHAGHGRIAWSHGGSCGVLTVQSTIADHLPTDQETTQMGRSQRATRRQR